MINIPESSLNTLFLANTPLIDVRAPVEFLQGSLPGAVNLPLMEDSERAAVGTTYKSSGREAAIELGHQLVSGAVKQRRLEAWKNFIQANPTAVLYCFRGGLRSQITQQWMGEMGLKRPLIEGGYKVGRSFLLNKLQEFCESISLVMVSGPTGSAKTHLLRKLLDVAPSVDLEAFARHRGSAFGNYSPAQPSQIDFENQMILALMKQSSMGHTKILVEDESRLIGRCAIPENFFLKMRSSPVIFVDESFEQRVENIFQDYISKTVIGLGDPVKGALLFASYLQSLSQITTKLGGLRAEEIREDIEFSKQEFLKNPGPHGSNKQWISKLLTYYYDPMYARSLLKRAPKILFRGRGDEVREFLKSDGLK